MDLRASCKAAQSSSLAVGLQFRCGATEMVVLMQAASGNPAGRSPKTAVPTMAGIDGSLCNLQLCQRD